MATATTYTKTGNKSQQTAQLPKDVFGVSVKDYTLLKQAYLTHVAKRRQPAAKALTRSEVRGGGRKPWRQKGTGNARAGSIRSPIWRGGGVTFGPTGAEDHRINLTRKAKRLAIRQALSLKAQDNEVVVLEDFAPKQGKVKEARAVLEKMEAQRGVVLVVDEKTAYVDRATRNLPYVTTVSAPYLNVFTIMNADSLVITKPALQAIKAWLAPASAAGGKS